MTKETKLRIHYIIGKGALKFGGEQKREEHRLETSQMRFLRHILGITESDSKRNHSVRKKLGVQNIVLEIQQYQRKWLQHLERLDTSRMRKLALKYKPKGRRKDTRKKGGEIDFTLRVKEQSLRQILLGSW
jgi:hypothetical protein